MIVQDVDRPDVNGKLAKMASDAEQIEKTLSILPFVKVQASDNLCSSITIRGSLDTPDQWKNGIFENGRSFLIMIFPEKRKRYYEPGDKVTAQTSMNRLGKFRKYTSSPEKVARRIYDWIELQKKQQEK